MKLIERKNGANTPIKPEDVTVDNMTLGELKESVKELSETVKQYQEVLEGKLILPSDRSVIVEIDGKLQRGKVSHFFEDNGQSLFGKEVKDGKIKNNKKRGIL